MKGYITLEFDGKPSHYINIDHITMIINDNGYAELTFTNGDRLETNRKFEEVIKLIKEQKSSKLL